MTLPDNKELIIGSSSGSDFMYTDHSIDASHATLCYNQELGEVVLNDTNSKYGSMILINRPMKLTKIPQWVIR